MPCLKEAGCPCFATPISASGTTVTICGNTVISPMQITRQKRNGIADLAIGVLSLPVMSGRGGTCVYPSRCKHPDSILHAFFDIDYQELSRNSNWPDAPRRGRGMRQVGVIMQADELKATTSDGAAIVDACKGEKINPSSSNPTKKANHAMGSVIAICFGACAGALARWQLGLWLSAGSLIPWGTLAANLIGGYLVGVCVATFQAMPQIDAVWRLLLVTGFLGALTTFSTFSAEVIGLLQQGRYALALGTASLHLFGSLLLTLAGIKTAIFLIAAYAR